MRCATIQKKCVSRQIWMFLFHSLRPGENSFFYFFLNMLLNHIFNCVFPESQSASSQRSSVNPQTRKNSKQMRSVCSARGLSHAPKAPAGPGSGGRRAGQLGRARESSGAMAHELQPQNRRRIDQPCRPTAPRGMPFR